MAKPTNPTNPGQGPVVTTSSGQVLAPAGAVTPKKHNQDLIRERRESIAALLDKGVTSYSRIAGAVGVSHETVRRDLKAIRQERKEGISKKAGPEQAVDIIGRFDEIARNAMIDYTAIKDTSPRANAVKATLLQTSLRATLEKANFMISTGVITPNIGDLEKQLASEQESEKIRGKFDPEIAAVLTSSESRRRVLDVVEKLKAAPPDLAAAMLDALDEADGERSGVVEPVEPEEEGEEK